jgi:formylglycine-generating enzyme required for sulfatase activity
LIGFSWDSQGYFGMSASVSAYGLDTFEVTVGRFRSFVKEFDPIHWQAGVAANAHVAGSGWDDRWTLPATAGELAAGLRSCGAASSWTDAPGLNENRPINCVSWFELFAFCAWDGRRLPTFNEHQYAANGGDRQGFYPWSTGPGDRVLSSSLAVYSWGDGASQMPLEVGSKPKGASRWGQLDLAGNVAEWVLDRFPPSVDYMKAPCVNCADLAERLPDARAVVGGSYATIAALELANTALLGQSPTFRHASIGGRCATNR